MGTVLIIDEVLEIFRISRPTLMKWVEAGIIHPIRAEGSRVTNTFFRALPDQLSKAVTSFWRFAHLPSPNKGFFSKTIGLLLGAV